MAGVWQRWICSTDEELPPPTLPGKEVSHSEFLVAVGVLFWVLRRLSLQEHLKHWFWDPLNDTISLGAPAKWVDRYVVGSWVFWFLAAVGLGSRSALVMPLWLWWVTVVLVVGAIVQNVQNNVFHIVWRGVVRPNFTKHHHYRSLLLSMLSFAQIGWLFGIAYWLMSPTGVQNCDKEPLGGVFEAVYFSYVVLATVGFGDFAPKSPGARFLVVLESLAGIMMLALIVARAVGSLPPGRDANEAKPERPGNCSSDGAPPPTNAT